MWTDIYKVYSKLYSTDSRNVGTVELDGKVTYIDLVKVWNSN